MNGDAHLLVVDDDRAARRYLALALEDAGYEISEAENGLEALLAVEQRVPDAVLTDLQMPELDGLELLTRVGQRWPDVPVVLLTVVQDVATVVDAVRRGARDYLVKPVSPGTLLSTVRGVLRHRSPPAGAAEAGVHEIIGRSRAMVEVRHLAALAARSEVNVMITGETGTGKELVARAVHRASARGESPLVAHNCSATPRELFEAEFFGACRGAFTGATDDRRGLLEQADEGTLFLDELETLDPAHQAKLLRVMDDGAFRRVGDAQPRRTSARFIAATNRDPRTMVETGELREDLYYRLRGLEIVLPPLRERLSDVPALVRSFLGPDGPSISGEALERLQRHAWPGNVRELRNVVRAAVALCDGDEVTPVHLQLDAARAAEPAARPDGFAPRAARSHDTATASAEVSDRFPSLREVERAHIHNALVRTDHNLTQAARMLGIDRSTLRRKLARDRDRRMRGD